MGRISLNNVVRGVAQFADLGYWLAEPFIRRGHATDAVRLDLALGRPVLVVDSTDVDTLGEPLTTKRSRFAAERVEFLVENGL